MSTRSILALQKGNKVRYCFVHWDGGNHGQTLKEMLDSEIEDLFQKMSPVEDGLYIGLDHLHPKAYWEAYVKANREDWVKRGLPQKDFDLTYLRPQPTAYDPVVEHQVGPLEHDTLGAFTRESDEPPASPREALGGNLPFVTCEYLWFYNLDTRKLTMFSGKNGQAWNPVTSTRRKRLTPKKYDFSDWFN
jgi:hypothetical protein